VSASLKQRLIELLSQKMKYAQKTLSDDSIEANFFTILTQFDTLSFSFDITLSDTLFSSLLSSLMFGLPLSEVIPWTLDFTVELPTPEEFVRGLLIKLEPIDITKFFPELLTLSLTYYNTFEYQYASQLVQVQMSKGFFGVSRYNQSYYDPEAVRQFIKSTMYALTKKRSTDETVKSRLSAVANALNISDTLTQYLFNALQMLYYAKFTACSFDYCWFDVSPFPKESSEAKVVFVGWDLVPVEADYVSIVDASGGCWFDNCVIDYSFFMPDETPTIYIPERAGNLVTQVASYLVSSARSRLLTTALAAANYQTAEERVEPRKSVRVETYFVPRYVADAIRNMVAKMLSNKAPYPYLINLYSDAAVNLYAILTRPRGWGDEAFRAMTRDEIYSSWVQRWTSQGLDKGILDQIFALLYDSGYIRTLEQNRLSQREVVRSMRGG